MKLTQIIVNTKGQVRHVTQSRNAKGQFGPAIVGGLSSYGITTGLDEDKGVDVVVVQHGLYGTVQTVTTVNKQTKQGRAFSFLNDGYRVSEAVKSVYNASIK